MAGTIDVVIEAGDQLSGPSDQVRLRPRAESAGESSNASQRGPSPSRLRYPNERPYVETVTIAGDTSSAITVIDGDTARSPSRRQARQWSRSDLPRPARTSRRSRPDRINGAAGATGATGPQGATGPAGPQEQQGPLGPATNGEHWPQGATGATGSRSRALTELTDRSGTRPASAVSTTRGRRRPTHRLAVSLPRPATYSAGAGRPGTTSAPSRGRQALPEQQARLGRRAPLASSQRRHRQPRQRNEGNRRLVGTTAGTVAAGDDARITGAAQRSGATFTGDIEAPNITATTSLDATAADTYRA